VRRRAGVPQLARSEGRLSGDFRPRRSPRVYLRWVSLARQLQARLRGEAGRRVMQRPERVQTELAELSAPKTDLEGVARNLNNRFTKLAERLDRMERAEADLHAKLAHIGEAVDRLEMARGRVKASDAAPAGGRL
jgi:hypothetical protein